jgi:hypothetical protein
MMFYVEHGRLRIPALGSGEQLRKVRPELHTFEVHVDDPYSQQILIGLRGKHRMA